MSFTFEYNGQQLTAPLSADLSSFQDLLHSFVDLYQPSTLDSLDDVSGATLDSCQFYLKDDATADRLALEEVSQITDGSTVEVVMERRAGSTGGGGAEQLAVSSTTGEDMEKERLRRELEAMKAKLSQLEGKSGDGERKDRK